MAHGKFRYGNQAAQLITEILINEEIERCFRDEAITAVLLGESADQFLEEIKEQLLENGGELLKRFCFITRVSGKISDTELIEKLAGNEMALPLSFPLYLKPHGNSWLVLIRFIYENRLKISGNVCLVIIEFLSEWASIVNINTKVSPIGRQVGFIVLQLLDGFKNSYRDNGNRKRILSILIRVSSCIPDEFNQLLDLDIFDFKDGHKQLPYVKDFCDMMLTGIETVFICKYFPYLVIRLAEMEWLIGNQEEDSRYRGRRDDVETCFGLHHYKSSKFFPPSGDKGPFRFLLLYHSRKALDFLITFFNVTADGKIQRYDVSVAKNYLTQDELSSLGRVVSAYLDLAEDRARRHIPMTMEDWAKRLDLFLQMDDREILTDAGRMSAQIAKEHAESEFEKYRIIQDKLFQSDFDKLIDGSNKNEE